MKYDSHKILVEIGCFEVLVLVRQNWRKKEGKNSSLSVPGYFQGVGLAGEGNAVAAAGRRRPDSPPGPSEGT